MIARALFLTVSLFALAASPAWAQEKTAHTIAKAVKETTPPTDYVIARVDGEAIKASEAEKVLEQFFGNAMAPDFSTLDEKVKQSVLREVINKRLIYNDAANQGYEKNPEVLKRLEEIRRHLVVQVYVEDKARGLITEDRLKAAYEAKVKKLSSVEEVRARHILVPSEAEAREIQKKLKNGADFAALAKEKSEDKGSRVQGGDLGYFTRDQMIPEFSAAAFSMMKGEISDPVKSNFGWHVIKVEDRRKAPIPTYEASKESLKADIVNQEIDALLANLMDRAKVVYYGPDGKEKPFAKKRPASTETAPKSAKPE